MPPRIVAIVVGLGLVTMLPAVARAQEGTRGGSAVRRDDLPVDRPTSLHPTPMDDDPMRHWMYNPVRTFLAVTADAGYVYARPTIQLGYGRPHFEWVGLEFLPQFSQGFAGLYAGWRAALPFLQVRAGARLVRPLFRPQLPEAVKHDDRELEVDRGKNSSYRLLELEALPELRVGPGVAIGVLTALSVQGIDPGVDLYEETTRVITRGPVILRARAGYLFDVRPLSRAQLGPVAEVIGVPARPNGTTVRAGLLAIWRLHEQVDIMVQLLPAILSPDSLGLQGADFSQLGVRYRFATPDLPGPEEK